MTPRGRHIAVTAAAAAGICAAVAAIVIVYGRFDPASAPFPKCVFKLATGLDCPGCGSQRAVHALLNGHFLEALRYNALFLAEIPLIALIAMGQTLRNRMPRLFRFTCSRAFILTILVVIILWTILRNIFIPL